MHNPLGEYNINNISPCIFFAPYNRLCLHILLRTSLGEKLMIQCSDIHQLKKLRHPITRINLLPIRAEVHHQPFLFTIRLPFLGDFGSVGQCYGVSFAGCICLVRRVDDEGEHVFDILDVFFGADVAVAGDECFDVHGEEFIADGDPVGEWTGPDNGEAFELARSSEGA